MIFRQLIDGTTSTFTYLLADEETREAVLIDTVFEQHLRDLAMIRELNLKLLCTLETHVHADHATGAWLMKQAVGSKIALAKQAGAEGADTLVVEGDKVTFGSHELVVRETPGHTGGCLTFVLGEEMAFTGDALLIRGAGRTDFQEGDPAQLFRSVREKILSLPESCRIYPGHDYKGRTATTVAEERAHNPRLGDGIREQDFVGYMKNLGLPHPKRMADAVPANLRCGQPKDLASMPKRPDWGPVIRTFAAVWQIEPEWVHLNLDSVHVIDVREKDELEAGPLGVVAGATLMPLSTLRDHLDDVPRDRPIILTCPAGARSAIAATILEKAGIEKVANMRGGLLEWRSLGLPAAKP